jgi:hypothetical protein
VRQESKGRDKSTEVTVNELGQGGSVRGKRGPRAGSSVYLEQVAKIALGTRLPTTKHLFPQLNYLKFCSF